MDHATLTVPTASSPPTPESWTPLSLSYAVLERLAPAQELRKVIRSSRHEKPRCKVFRDRAGRRCHTSLLYRYIPRMAEAPVRIAQRATVDYYTRTAKSAASGSRRRTTNPTWLSAPPSFSGLDNRDYWPRTSCSSEKLDAVGHQRRAITPDDRCSSRRKALRLRLGGKGSFADRAVVADTAGRSALGSCSDGPLSSLTRIGEQQTACARARRQRRDGPGSGARAEAILAGCIASIALVARKTSGGPARVRRAI